MGKTVAKFWMIALITLFSVISLGGLFPQGSRAQNNAITIAVAAPLSGDGASGGQEIVDSIKLYIDATNREGGINGRPLKLNTYDDKGNANGATQVANDIAKSDALVVLGHRSSDASIAAGSIYQDKKLPAITGTANSPKVTSDRPYYFRIIYTNPALAKTLSIYAQQVLQIKTASVIYDKASKNELAQSEVIKSAFEANDNGKIQKIWGIDSDPNNRKASVQQIVNEIATEPEAGILFLTLSKEEVAEDFLVALKQKGLKNLVLGEQALGRESFAKRFEKYDEEKKNAGFFTDGMYVPLPILFDSAGADAQDFLTAYQKAYNKTPSYLGAKFYEAAIIAVDAIRKANSKGTNVEGDREQVRDALSKLNNRKVGIRGLTGLLYFNSDRNSDQPVRLAQFQNQKLISASQQFTPITNPERLNLPKELQSGSIVQTGDQYFWRQRVVYAGMDINKLNRIDKSSFTADFYVWFRYSGSDEPTEIQFPDAVTNSVNPTAPVFDGKAPIKAQVVNGLNYRLYRVRGEFRNAFDFRDYPFDSQKLNLRFDNPILSTERLVYAIDTVGLKLPRAKDAERRPFQGLQLWNFKDITYFQDSSRSTSTQGDPDLVQSNAQIEYPGLSIRMTFQRKTIVFLSKNVSPLILLSLLTYCCLFFPYTMFVPRTMAPASALLSGIVLLLSFNNQLPEVGYTVAMEYVFYVYFCLCLLPIIVTAIGTKLDKDGHKKAFKYLNIASWIAYPLILITTVAAFAISYSDRLI
ncbi:MAG: ABC transporter substrate-binding protein [Pseudanabaena sp. M158S2SP1A06QC]|jgi:branched-chain amino acid transport system substrate-binding protein|uniref:ABC transporter substrate-binding protein n=1 Tax=Pseudanabaena mucicola TaxID=71190 RepID=UPI000E8E696E|nr:ABC transporter substrate-binding protein [Pseudanabaena mucicola]MCA6572184.1 ABC transporter substrate-binding protein [Pseudanabaena sp. M53BS1SP1A06MG]MCA6584792.1 ABC transporter substrate-binding protein [Pseudanabaena sp. M34BS1SP1A06MG]MCA6588333.1 ABC transporter substrate-binding protein [Pseudanabaena sp. M109S1SP1A06QC]MCA6594278.1 ABC transporter substrate-binding protein [Pseudanabaena sp. M38BS1SP1A06MG]MCA6600885.1 ABC transporter substrate-binding protein [Pseudanabaena sp.